MIADAHVWNNKLDVLYELGDSDNDSGRVSRQTLKKKRGKKAASDELSDVSMEDSVSGSTRGRKIGEEGGLGTKGQLA